MPALYDRLRGTASKLIDKFQQGTVEFQSGETVTSDDPLSLPVKTKSWTEYNCTVSGVSEKYVGRNGITTSDLEIITQVPLDVSIDVGDYVRIDGVQKVILENEKVPASGTPVYNVVIVKS